jgi:hypothetical protein
VRLEATMAPITPVTTAEATADSFELVSSPLPTLSRRDRSLPFRPFELARLLLDQPDLAPSERSRLEQLVRILGAAFHYQFYDWLNELKRLYAPIDPDSDCVNLRPCPPPSEADGRDPEQAFLGPFEAALIRANYVPLDRAVLEGAISAPNELGLDYVPNLHLFDHLRVYVRGEGRVRRSYRGLKTWFRKRTVSYDCYRRVVIALKYQPGNSLDDYVRSDVLYLRLFKDVPFVEMDMHLPEQGTKIKMRWLDKLQIASPVMTGLPALAARLLYEATFSPALMAFILFVPISAGVRSFFGYKTARRRYLHYMIRHLYYLTLANNASVIDQVVDSAEEEEFKEALLAYYFLWRGSDEPEPWTNSRLQNRVETFLLEKTHLAIDFEVSDAVNKLIRLGLVQANAQGHLAAVPIEQGLQILDEQWDDYFSFA